MKVYTLTKKQVVPARRDKVFAFFERPENLALITPPSMRFKIMTPGEVTMRAGALIDYSVTILGIGQHWRTYISEYSPPDGFVDEQLKGPYTFWHHSHRFIDNEDETTTIIDEISYVVPFGILGRLFNSLIIARQLASIFRYRASVIDRMFGKPDESPSGMTGEGEK